MPPTSSTTTTTTLLLLLVAGTATGWLAFTPSGQATIKYIWEGDKKGARKKVAIKQLNYLKKEVRSLGERIERAAGRVEEALRQEEEEEGKEGGEEEEEEEEEEGGEESAASTSAYYHFSSSGKKFKNKWDEYDVEEELRRLEKEGEEGGKEGGKEGRKEGGKEGGGGGTHTTAAGNGNGNGEARQRGEGRRRRRNKEGGREGGKPTLGRVRTEVGQVQSDLEKAMGHLDSVRGDEEVRQRRKGLVLESHGLFRALDAVTQRLV